MMVLLQHPWAEFDSGYQIMFKVGMGETPAVPDSLSEEGHQFLQLCLQHDPRQRASARELLHHTFVKVSPLTQEFEMFDLNSSLQGNS
jgi:mitogen-activated protein kinase kinase kinase 4/mitogen-activated protein kinase kinase kinase